MADAIISTLATLAKQKAMRQSERARANGKALGRLMITDHRADAVRALRGAVKSLRAVAKGLGSTIK